MIIVDGRRPVTQTGENRRFDIRMGDIGEEQETIIFAPIEVPETEPVVVPAEPEPVPA